MPSSAASASDPRPWGPARARGKAPRRVGAALRARWGQLGRSRRRLQQQPGRHCKRLSPAASCGPGCGVSLLGLAPVISVGCKGIGVPTQQLLGSASCQLAGAGRKGWQQQQQGWSGCLACLWPWRRGRCAGGSKQPGLKAGLVCLAQELVHMGLQPTLHIQQLQLQRGLSLCIVRVAGGCACRNVPEIAAVLLQDLQQNQACCGGSRCCDECLSGCSCSADESNPLMGLLFQMQPASCL